MAIARVVPGEIIVADCMQVYRGLDIGTGKPSAQERATVPHHLVDVCDPADTFSAHAFATRAARAVHEIRGRGRIPILVGGTGLYLRAFLTGNLAGRGADPALRERLRREAQAGGTRALFERLRATDPASAARIHPEDQVRIVRALELAASTGRRPSEWRTRLWDPPQVPGALMLVLTRERNELSTLIDARAHRMWAGGLLEEVRGVLAQGYPADLRPLRAIGYRQAVGVVQGELSAAEGLQSMQRATRQYAKRQLTWYRREPAAEWVTVRGWAWVESLAGEILERLDRGLPRLDPAAARPRTASTQPPAR
jgi:tRNA dimethylallyltransferase